MYIITDKDTDVIAFLSPDIGYQTNGNPLVNGGTLAIGFPCNVSADVTIPDGVCEQKYTYKDGVFAKNPNYPWPKLEDVKSDKITLSKKMLAEYLESHPLVYTDGKTYSVTAEKQSLLTGNLSAYSIAVQLGVTPNPLTWNTTGSECTEWTFANLGALALAIQAYVKPFVSYQQSKEVAINACTTVEDVESLAIDYSSVVAH